MVELRILGSVRLQAPDGRDVQVLVRHPKRTALLAYLAAALPRGPHRRDTLLALFWPESDAAHARAALNQALYVLRTTLGEQAIVSHGAEEVGLNGDVVWCDAAAFEAALEAGLPADALALYRGDLLDGFFVRGAPDFEHWLDRGRARLRERASQGAWALAEASAVAGDVMEGARWARCAAELMPADEAVARRLMRFLSRLGDRAAAIRAYEAFVSRLAREYELDPSGQTRALAEAIRRAESASAEAPALAVASVPAPPNDGAKQPQRSPARSAWRVPRARRRVGAALALVTLLSLFAGGWLLLSARLGSRSAENHMGPKRLAVLPFTNVGPAEEEYFADGVTEEIAARLAAIDRLRIIGRTSGNQYKGSQKTIREIGAELGVDYVLEGSVRWQKSGDGPARVRVTPQLVSTADGTRLWAAVYDEPLDEIFEVQSDIAQKVVQALDVTLPEPQRRLIEAAPTANLEAYDYYLRGNSYMHRLEEPYARAAVRMYEQAVELDPRFALAYARLARIHSRIYWLYYDRSPERLELAERAVATAFKLEPDLPQAHLALGAYYWLGHLDYDRALREFAIAEAGMPNENDVFAPRAVLRMRQGDFRRGFEDYEKVLQLDPGSGWFAYNHAVDRDFVRDFARAEALYDRAIALSPDMPLSYSMKTDLYLRWEGNTQKARTVLEEAGTLGLGDEPLMLFARVRVDLFDRRYQDAIGHLSSGFPEVISWQSGFIPRVQLSAEVHALMGRPDLARADYDSARILVYNRLQSQPDDPRLHGALGIAYAGLGRKQEAIEEGRKGVELLPVSRESHRGYYREWDLARIYAMVGESDAALDHLEYLLSIPGHLTPAWLRIDPTWDPLRGHPRFQRLLDRAQ